MRRAFWPTLQLSMGTTVVVLIGCWITIMGILRAKLLCVTENIVNDKMFCLMRELKGA